MRIVAFRLSTRTLLAALIRSLATAFVALAGLSALGGCSSTQSITASDASLPVTVDGSEADWSGALNPVAKQPGLAVGARMAPDALYVVAVLRNDRQVRQALARGLTLWINSTGDRDRVLGIRFPLGPPPGSGPPPASDGRMTDAMRQRFAAATVDLEVLRDGEDEGLQLSASGASGIAASAKLDGDILVVEYKIPYDGAYGLDAQSAARLGLGLTTLRSQAVGIFTGGTNAAERAEERSARGSATGGRQNPRAEAPPLSGTAFETPLDVWLTVMPNGKP